MNWKMGSGTQSLASGHFSSKPQPLEQRPSEEPSACLTVSQNGYRMKLKVSGFRDNSRTQRDSSNQPCSMQIPRETHVTVTNVFFFEGWAGFDKGKRWDSHLQNTGVYLVVNSS